jgi:hypothetical protein
MISLQLGQPIQEENKVAEWSEEDKARLEEAFLKLDGLGWRQTDIQGTNFIWLLGGDGIECIAVIDFESMAK